jgi:hypothetical protein
VGGCRGGRNTDRSRDTNPPSEFCVPGCVLICVLLEVGFDLECRARKRSEVRRRSVVFGVVGEAECGCDGAPGFGV